MRNKQSALLDRPNPSSATNSTVAISWFAEMKVPPVVQDRLDDFAERNTEGLLTPAELEEYKLLVDVCDYLSLAKVRAIGYLQSLKRA